MNLTEAIILAEGAKSESKSQDKDVPKSMTPINGRPFLEYILDDLIKNKIERVIFSITSNSKSIAYHFGDRYKNCELVYIYEEDPLGTGGAIKTAIKSVNGEHVLVTNSDSIFITDIQGQFVFHQNREADVTLGVKAMSDSHRYRTVIADNNSRIHNFREKESASNGLINTGVYIFNVKVFTSIDFPQTFSLVKDYFQTHTKESKFYGYQSDGYFLDIGIPEDFAKAQEEFLRFK